MIYCSSVYGAFNASSPQMYALSKNVSLADGPAFDIVNNSVFTLGTNGQANIVQGVAEGKKYAANLKWSYGAIPSTDSEFHAVRALSSGCSTGNTNSELNWTGRDTVFSMTEPVTISTTWYFGKVSASTGSHALKLFVTCNMRTEVNLSASFSASGVPSFTTYARASTAFPFKYALNVGYGVDSGSYSNSIRNGISDMTLYCSTNEPDFVENVTSFECVFGEKLFKFDANAFNFGKLVAGTRPKVQTFLTHTLDL